MIIDENKTTSVGKGFGETREFTANLDGMMFENMINGIYSDKIAAPIRELSTNARDGHAKAGKLEKPFDVFLPTRLEPEFKVRDYGTSLTHEEIMDMYTVLGMSTKRDTNDETGCLGLGSKSPFAYTTTFTVTCWQHGEKRVYSAFKQTGGRPACTLIHTTKSNEPTGMEVAFAVRNGDVEAFNKSAKKVFIGFKPRPNVVRNSSTFEWDDRVPVISSKHGDIFPKASAYSSVTNSYAIQGSVAYPLEMTESLKAAIYAHPDIVKPARYPYTAAEEELVSNADIRLYFDIGELTMTTSREELAYDEKTCTNIVKRLHAIIKEQSATLNNRWANEKNLYEAQKKFSKDVADGDVINTIAKMVKVVLKPEFQGKKLFANYVWHHNAYEDNKLTITKISGTRYDGNCYREDEKFDGIMVARMRDMQTNQNFGNMKASFAFKKASEGSSSEYFHNIAEDKYVHWFVQEKTDTFRINNRIRNIWVNECSKYNKPMYVIVDKLSEWEKVRKMMMIPNKNITMMKDVKELPMPTAPKGTSTTAAAQGEADLRKIVPSRYGSNSSSTRIRIDLNANDKYVRVWQAGSDFFWNKKDWEDLTNGISLQQMMYRLHEKSSYITKDVIALNKTNAKLDKEFGHLFVDYEVELQNALRSKLSDAEKLINRSNVEANLGGDSRFYELINKVDEQSLPNFLKQVPQLMSTYQANVSIQLSGSERELLEDLEEAFPKTILSMRQKATKKGLNLLDVPYILSTYPVLTIMYKYYTEVCNRYWSSEKEKREQELVKSLTHALKLLKKDGN